jgi:radical SAM superfamily enzyme YgiQ (UPF0313 family)/ubiquinone/menaquinone biosynthesis C-methylase UbiE
MKPELFDELIKELLDQERYDDVSVALEYYLHRFPNMPIHLATHYIILSALIHSNKGDVTTALDLLQQGLATTQLDPELNYTVGILYLKIGKYHEALFHLRTAWNGKKSSEKYRSALIEAFARNGHPDPLAAVDPCDERMYLYPDKEMGIAFNAYDTNNVRRHTTRYHFAASMIGSAENVLDAACGTGYGSEIVAQYVGTMTGVDLDEETVLYARKHHSKPNTHYLQGNLNLLNLGHTRFDSIISLETLEHISDPRPYLNNLSRLMVDNGTFIVSTPISREGGPSKFNKYHLFEYNLLQFNTLLAHYFHKIDIYVQHVDSRIEPLTGTVPESGFLIAACREPTRNALPLDGDFRCFIAPESLRRQLPVQHLGLIMAKGNDTRDYGIPLGLGYIGAYLLEKAPHFKVTIALDEREIIESKPDIIGISSVTSTYGHAVLMAKKFRNKLGNIPVVIGGPHITRLPQSLDPVFSAGVIGDGEQAMLEMMNAYNQCSPLTNVPGLVLHDGNGPSLTKERSLIDHLDTLPFPWRSVSPLTPNEATLFTSRGCPYQCAFCSSSREKFRAFSAEYVVSEIEHILSTMPGTNSLYFLDDLFIADKKRLRRIVELLDERCLLGKFSARGFVRANLLNNETASLLKKMNFTKVRFGAESGSKRILTFLKSGSVTVAQNQQCVDICNTYHLPVSGSFVFGTPGETLQDLHATFDFIEHNRGKMDVEGFYLLMPLPGTKMWDIAKHRGVVSETMDWSRLNLDMSNPDFNWDSFIYFNDSLPRDEFVTIIRNWLGLTPVDTALQPKHNGGMKIEIGCGEAPRPGYLHIDIRQLPGVDIVAPAWDLPFDNSSVSAVYSRHVLEHFVKADGEKALREWLRVLQPGGELHLIVPNIDFHLHQWLEGDQEWAMAGFWGWQKHEHDVHKWGYTWNTLSTSLRKVGYREIQNLTGQPYSQEKDEKHLEVKAYKP